MEEFMNILAPTHHEKIKKVFNKSHEGEIFHYTQIQKILEAFYPDLTKKSVQPWDHDNIGNKGACCCAATQDNSFERLGGGYYKVAPHEKE